MKSPAFQFYPADFLVGIMGFTDEETGIYIKMLAYQWLKGGLPNDPLAIKKVIHSRKKPSENVLKKFEVGSDLMLHNLRLEEERKKQEAFRESRVNNAKSRWDKPCTSNARALSSICKTDALHLQSSSSSSPSVIKKETAFDPLKAELPFSSETFGEAWASWCQHRKEKKEKLTETSVKMQLKALRAMGEATAIRAIEFSIEKGWTGIFPPKEPVGQQESEVGPGEALARKMGI